MPGYTHMQKAMPSSVGMWAGSFAESLIDDVALLKATLALIDQSPLGSAAGYGVPLPLDRAYTTKLLGFGKTQNNSLYCQNSRGNLKPQSWRHSSLICRQSINSLRMSCYLRPASLDFYGRRRNDDRKQYHAAKKNIDVAELLEVKSIYCWATIRYRRHFK